VVLLYLDPSMSASTVIVAINARLLEIGD